MPIALLKGMNRLICTLNVLIGSISFLAASTPVHADCAHLLLDYQTSHEITEQRAALKLIAPKVLGGSGVWIYNGARKELIASTARLAAEREYLSRLKEAYREAHNLEAGVQSLEARGPSLRREIARHTEKIKDLEEAISHWGGFQIGIKLGATMAVAAVALEVAADVWLIQDVARDIAKNGVSTPANSSEDPAPYLKDPRLFLALAHRSPSNACYLLEHSPLLRQKIFELGEPARRVPSSDPAKYTDAVQKAESFAGVDQPTAAPGASGLSGTSPAQSAH